MNRIAIAVISPILGLRKAAIGAMNLRWMALAFVAMAVIGCPQSNIKNPDAQAAADKAKADVTGAGQKSSPVATPARDKAAIRKMERDWADLVVRRDTAAMLGMGTDDCMFMDASGHANTLKQIVADVKSGALTFESMHIDDLKVRIYGDAAVVFGLETQKSKYKGEDTSGQYRFTDTWVKRNGRWFCVVAANTRVSPAKP
ncbi:MAG: nuclear transport factor 2 family protein [Verrucomicrobiota bacterium]